jgi:hypothetical protein
VQRADVRIAARGRAFEPIVGVLADACVLDGERQFLACMPDGNGWVLDVPARAGLVIAVGIDANDPALDTLVGDEGLDPLDYEIDIQLRKIVAEGEICDSGQVRCEPGTACIAPDEVGAEDVPQDGARRCQRLEADTCATAESLVLDREAVRWDMPADARHTDAHHHGCVGARLVERVLRLGFPPDVRLPETVRVTAQGVLGLAIRRGGCERTHEAACASVDPDASAEVEVELEAASIREGVYVFVELPSEFAAGTQQPDPGMSGEEARPPVVLDFTQ